MTALPKTNLVLLPGLLCDARLFGHQVEALADHAHCTVADLTGADSMAALASGVLAQAPARFALAGLSMGGYVALEIMRQAPERVRGLALMDTSARPDTPEATANRHRLMKLAETHFQGVLDELLPKLVHPAHLSYNSIVDVVYSMGHRVGRGAFVRQQRAILGRIDSRPYLHQIVDCPTLVLCGREDALTPPALHEEMAAEIPNATLTLISGCGHLSSLEQPKAVAEALHAWLGRLSR